MVDDSVDGSVEGSVDGQNRLWKMAPSPQHRLATPALRVRRWAWEGNHESRSCSRDTHSEPYITKYAVAARNEKRSVKLPSPQHRPTIPALGAGRWHPLSSEFGTNETFKTRFRP